MAARVEKLKETLLGLRMSAPEIIGSAIVNTDGFIVASTLPSEIDEELVGGMAAALQGVGARISQDLMRDDMEQVYVRSPKGYVVMNAITKEHSLALLVTREAKLGLIFLELRGAVEDLSRSL